jgi:hypothetical protein
MFNRFFGGFSLRAAVAAAAGLFASPMGAAVKNPFTHLPDPMVPRGKGRGKRPVKRWRSFSGRGGKTYKPNGARDCARRVRKMADFQQIESHGDRLMYHGYVDTVMPRHIVGLPSARYEREQGAAGA